MSKTNNMTFNMIAAEMDEVLDTEITFDGKHGTMNIGVVRRLDFNKAMRFVRDVAGSCANASTGEYLPEAFDFSVKVNTLVYYAGFNAPDDIEKAYDVIYGTNLYEVIRNEIDEEQFFALVHAAKERVSNEREIMNNTQAAKMNELIDRMDAVMSEGDSIFDALTSGELNGKLQEVLAVVSTLETPGNNTTADNIVPLPTGNNA